MLTQDFSNMWQVTEMQQHTKYTNTHQSGEDLLLFNLKKSNNKEKPIIKITVETRKQCCSIFKVSKKPVLSLYNNQVKV